VKFCFTSDMLAKMQINMEAVCLGLSNAPLCVRVCVCVCVRARMCVCFFWGRVVGFVIRGVMDEIISSLIATIP